MPFLNKLVVTETPENRVWQLESPLEYLDGKRDQLWSVPVGFKTDFASVPKALWNILPPTGSYTKAAVLHDFFYQTQPVTRLRADNLFMSAMSSMAVPLATRLTLWAGVRLGGLVVWLRRRRRRRQLEKLGEEIRDPGK